MQCRRPQSDVGFEMNPFEEEFHVQRGAPLRRLHAGYPANQPTHYIL